MKLVPYDTGEADYPLSFSRFDKGRTYVSVSLAEPRLCHSVFLKDMIYQS